MDRLTPEREDVIRAWVGCPSDKQSRVSWRGFVVALLAEIDALREDIERMKQNWREALKPKAATPSQDNK